MRRLPLLLPRLPQVRTSILQVGHRLPALYFRKAQIGLPPRQPPPLHRQHRVHRAGLFEGNRVLRIPLYLEYGGVSICRSSGAPLLTEPS